MNIFTITKSKTIFILPLVSALLLTLSAPGHDQSYFLFIAFVPIMISILLLPNRWLLLTILFTYTYSLYNFFWVTETVNYFGDVDLWIRAVLWFLMATYISLYYILFFYIFKKVESPLKNSLVFAVLELVRGKLFTGFPWMNVGLHALGYKPLALNAFLLGEIGVSFLVILINIYITYTIFKGKRYLFALIIIISLSHLTYLLPKPIKKSATLDFSIVQPSYNYLKKWDPEQRENVTIEVLSLLDQAIKTKSDIVVSPESSFPFFVQNDPHIWSYLLTQSKSKPILLGNIRYSVIDGKTDLYNSNFFFNDETVALYDKIHLVPFGEYFPLKIITAPIQRYFFGDNFDFKNGEKIVFFDLKGTKIGNLICYEDAFYELMLKNIKNGAEIMVVTTNDSWFGNSLGRYQHFAISLMRSIESGRSIIRSSQSGISACIQPYGETTAQKGLNEKGVLECKGITNSAMTPFSIISYWWLLPVGIVAFVRKSKTSNS
ncbi:MAG: apolipoprotein N-acyltransferase [Calditerrivibrio sp.]|nr:apolipoprotein N-acyltransferase [Calditerrivibrio sp.]